ncbi:dehydrogenase [Corynebacterium aquatimens]|nr:dehydrogenase [Corynebacterium aquatimens]UIZ92870.1 dehydrogenase [Corynebacterium sp. CNCTC7651]
MSRLSPLNWPVVRQLRDGDLFARGEHTESARTKDMQGRIVDADRVVKSVCPYCAVGCGQRVYVKDDKVIQIEGDPDSPHSRGRLCPKGAASEQLVNAPNRLSDILYRAPRAKEWVKLDRETALEMVTDRFMEARENGWQDTDEKGRPVRRTMGIAGLGGAAMDNEENYLIKKLWTASGAVQIENQARI